MADILGLGFSGRAALPRQQRTEHVVLQQPLRRVLAFTRRTIHDVINDPIAKHEVLGYYKLHCWVERGCEIGELERQWNSH